MTNPLSSDPPSRVLRLLDRPLEADDRLWLVSPSGLPAASRVLAAAGDGASLEAILTSALWDRLVDASPYPLGRWLHRRGRSLVAAARMACGGPPGTGTDPAARAAVAAGLWPGTDVGAGTGTGAGGNGAGDADGGQAGQPLDERALVLLDELVAWMTADRPAPLAVRRVTFLVDQHSTGRLMRLTLARYPGLRSFGPDLVANPFTIADAAFQQALDDARAASGNEADGVRWSVTWDTGEPPLELQGASVGLAALAGFERLGRGVPVGTEAAWAFTGAVDPAGRVLPCAADGGERALGNKLRAAGRRPVVLAGGDAEAARRLVDAGGLPVRLHEVHDRATLRALLDAARPSWLVDTGTPAVGRAAELARLEEAAVRVAAGRAEVVCLTGDPGIGKTRLAREAAARRYDEGWQVAWGPCYEAEATADYRPAAAALRSVLALHDDGRDDLGALVGPDRADLAILLPELGAGANGNGSGAGARPGDGRLGDERQMALFDAVAALIRRAAAVRPLAVVVDDAHWADRSSLQLLGHVLRHCSDRPILVVVGYRHNEVTDELVTWLGEARASCPVETLHLAGLDEPATRSLLAQMHGDEAPDDFTRSMFTVTAGNPLFIHELSRHSRTTGALDPRRGQWRVDLDGSTRQAGLGDVLSRRFRALSDLGVELCRYVAASSGGLPFEVLREAAGADPLAVLDALDQAVGAGVLEERAGDGVGLVYEFSHVLFRQVLVEPATAARRARYHLALAAALAGQPDPSERWVAEISYHVHQAGPVGAGIGGGWRTCGRAGELALARTAYDDAATHFGRAVLAAAWAGDADAATIAALELRHAEALHRSGDRAGRQELASRSFERAAGVGDAGLMGRAALVHGGARSTYGVPSVATMGMLARALDTLRADDPDQRELRAQVMSRLAQETYHVQRFDEAKALSAEALALMGGDAPSAVRAAVLDGRAWTLHTPDDLHQRLALADEMIEQAVRARDPEWEMMGRSWRCTALLELGDAAAIDRELAHLDELARMAPVPSHQFRIATLHCTRAMMSGRYDAGAELAGRAFEIGTSIEPENAMQTLCAQMLGMLREQGQLVGLVDTAEQMVDAFPMVPGWRAALAFVELEAGRPERARPLFDELAASGFTSVPRDLAWIQAQSYLAEVACAFADQRAAAVLTDLLAPFSGRNVGLFDIASNGAVDHYLGLLAATLGRRAEAIDRLRAAMALEDRSGQVVMAARSRLALGRVLEAGSADEQREAAGLLAAVADTAATLDLPRLAAEVAEALAAPAG